MWLKQNLLKPILDFIFPPVCLLCQKIIDDGDAKICTECWNSFTIVDETHPDYMVLKNRFISGGVIKDFTSSFLFEKEGKFQEAIHLLKYKGIKSVGLKLGLVLGEKINQNSFGTIDIVAPVPLHKLKLRERGYNQTDYICKGISQSTEYIAIFDLITRLKYTQSQTALTFQQRKENVSDAFVLNDKYKDLIRDKVVLLVDDVITTGATIEAVGRVLKSAGAKNVFTTSAGLAKGDGV
ncbi:MAG: phosphoribosyltransferase family protein [Bacteroidota bacterium]|nr:phosphoribosyltransferase family protein [Bacteroidota bacterium]